MRTADAVVDEAGAREATARTVASRPAGTQGTVATLALRTADDVLYANELRRSRVWVWLSGSLAVAGLGCAGLLAKADDVARLLLAGGCAVLLVAALIGEWVLATGRYSRFWAAVYSYFCLLAVMPAYYFFGWFSAIVLLVPIGGVTFSMGQSTRSVIAMAIMTVGTHAVVASLVIFGVVEDRALSALRVTGLEYEMAYLLMCEAMFLVSFGLGRLLRSHARADVERYGTAVRESARRDALLQEALSELERVRHAGEPGRFTGLTLGAYRLGVVLGRGAMGEVYEAEHETTGARAAVKVMSSAGALNERATARFEREIGVARTVDSAHIVRVLDCAPSDAPMMYLVMERLDGVTLGEILRGGHKPSVSVTLDMLRQVARGIDAVHAAGVVHRDLKPGNVFRHGSEAAPTWKVLDFGVSKLVDGSGTLTGAGVVGTPSYMSPEQASGADVGHWSDVFALGCIAYRCLTGRPAFSGREVVDILYAVVNDMPPRPSLLAQVPLEVDTILAIALAKQPDHRFTTCTELAEAVAAACRATISDDLERRGEALLALQPWRE